MERIEEIVVVEGKSDTAKLKTYFDVDTIETHGLALNPETIDFLKELSSRRGIIVFTDPDHPGEKIRQWINDAVPGLKNAFVLKKDARTSKKVGVEHASYEVLKEALDHVVTYRDEVHVLTSEDFYDLGLSGKDDSGKRRELIAEKYHIGKCNAKTMLKRLNMLGLRKEELEDLFQ